MRPALAALALVAAANVGCVHVLWTERNAPNRVAHLEQPPADLRARVVDKGEDPGARGWVGQATVFGGLDGGEREKVAGIFGVELAAAPFSVDRTASRTQLFDDALGKIWLRPAVGWEFVRSEEKSQRTYVGPMWGEVQAIVWVSRPLGMFSLGVGPRVELARQDAGAQATLCAAMHPALFSMCLRGSYEANAGASIGWMMTFTSYGVWAWSR